MLQKPYLLFLGEITDKSRAKMALSAEYFCPKDCIGFHKLPKCSVELDMPELSLESAKESGAKSFVIGVVNNGGYIEDAWIPTIVAAMNLGFDIVNGMHAKLEAVCVADQAKTLGQLASELGVQLHNVRYSSVDLPVGNGQKRAGKRLLTVGTDCSSGKMFTTLHLHNALEKKGVDSHFVATGQCGVLVSGEGIAIDAVGADFISGAVEYMTPDTDGLYLIEGQGSLFHPAYAGVSLGLLHGAQADYLIMCHDVSRKTLKNFDYPIPDIQACIALNAQLGRLTNDACQCIGVSLNTSSMTESAAQAYCHELRDRLQLPVTDPNRFGVDSLVAALQERGV
ncbi:DUF1611 domain-containing protein [Candidatus Marinamargulisbacteria bacterium SCGC AG-439-L15]|nr:DUF1611 domain-containing protein [Candidatus Marinamargulisbacteria bacterium SCGC AG-439-L15]